MDPTFHHNHGPFPASQIAAMIQAECWLDGQKVTDEIAGITLNDVASLESASTGDLAFLDNPKYIGQFEKTKASACICDPKHTPKAPKGLLLFTCAEPYAAYATVAKHFYPSAPVAAAISPQAHIDESASIGGGCRIDPGVVIEQGVTIGEGCHIGPNVHLQANVIIGDHCRIGANSTISHSILGSHVIIHRGVHIGQDGFGFAPGSHGVVKVPQLGRVIINDHVEIGSGTCIDRGAGPDTVIGAHTKIDNLVQIGHNVQIGSYCFLAGQTGIAGSAIIGNQVMLGGHSGVTGHISIGDKAKLAGYSATMVEIPAGETYVGIPARPHREFFKIHAMLNKMLKRKQDE